MRIEVDIRPIETESAIVYAPFDKALVEFRKNGYELISLLQNAGLRIQQGKNHDVSIVGNQVKEGVLYVPGEGRFITRHSAILDHPRKATQAHRKGKEYFVSDDQIGIAMRDSIKIPYDMDKIPIDWFGEEGITMFCFGKNAKDYGLFLKDAGIPNMLICDSDKEYVNEQNQPYARQLWLEGLGALNWSGLNGRNRNLHLNIRSRGVKVITEGTSQNSETYTPKEIAKAMKTLGISGLEENLLSKLRQ